MESILILIGGAGLLGLLLWGYRAYVRPLRRLAAAIVKYRDGEFGARVSSTGGALRPIELAFNEMGRKLDSLVSDLKRVDELKTDFISTVSHELRTPLTSIAGYTKLLAHEDAGPLNETQKEFLGIVDTNVQRLSELINDLLDIEKIEAGKIHLSRDRVDLVPILRECIETFSVLAAQKGLKLALVAPAQELVVIGDRARLFQIFMNLVSNAVKYTVQGEVEVRAEERNFAIVVEVRDTGIGISKEDQERLFEKFFRTRSAALSRQGGTGLGLSIARALVEGHHGKIQVESQVGVGTVFSVALPLAGTVAAVRPEGAETGSKVTNGVLPVWIVDASDADAAALALWLGSDPGLNKEFAIDVRRFRSVEDVARAVEQGAGTGRPPAAAIVEAGKNPEAVVAIASLFRKTLRISAPLLAIGESLDAAAAFARGATASLSKPIDETRFLRAVRELLRDRRRSVLIVDADGDMRLLIKRSLERQGFRVDDLDRGQDALRRLSQDPYDLVLVDAALPDVSAQDLLRVIHQDPALRGLPVFVMLGQDKAPPTPEELLAMGADQFVGKHEGIGGIVDAVYDFLEEGK
ncbi:MAG: hybrid sensor histidine kinase/response regulator [Oligoflexia bacterium]|nr:hybrid sensor histidine kinase/response regulator [Oligoflexia bacterium]